ncbi:MAG: tetratricopeptide repeat protein [Saprospiraceae bacterium]|nr:tetratricopeptide repeat protein [Saprospiraceae bacterium]
MKNGLFFLLLFAFGNAWSQAGRGNAGTTGANPLPTNDKGTTRALVVGISEYADSGIVDLRFAHRDAEIFAEYLHSAAGAGLSSENIRLLTNAQATLAAIDDGLNWLLTTSKKGDRVIVYFSGHGDVEKQTLWQRGYLLAHDTPGHNYRNNAVKVEDLDEIVKTLSISNEARVTVILDACRSGKLANIGPSLTAEQLEKQVENEVRILSCKPDQKSLEGENWGQGRGLFSFFLVNGLMGLADAGSFPDGIITLDELTAFVKTGIQQVLSDPSFSSRQNPVFVGDENYEVGEVNDKLQAAASSMDVVAMAAPGMKGVVEKGGDTATIIVTTEVFEAPSLPDLLHQFLDGLELNEFVIDTAFPALLGSQSTEDIDHFFIEKIAKQLQTEQANAAIKKELLNAADLEGIVKDVDFQEYFRIQLNRERFSFLMKRIAPETNPNSALLRESKYQEFTKDPTFIKLFEEGKKEDAIRFLIEKTITAVEVEIGQVDRKVALYEIAASAIKDPVQRQQFQLQLAIRLHDQAQEAINNYLRGDPGSLDKLYYKVQAEQYLMYPRMLETALLLLPEGHLLHHSCEVKLHYFDGVCTRLAGQMSDAPKPRIVEAFAKQKKALSLDDKAAYIHNELGLLYLATDQLDSALLHFRTAASLAPKWALPEANLCAVFIAKKQLDSAMVHGENAVAMQPDYFGAHLNLGVVAEKKHDLLTAENHYRKARELNDPHYLPFERRAYLQLESSRYEEAEWQFYEMELRKQGMVPPLVPNIVVATPLLMFPLEFKYPSLSGPGVVHSNPKSAKEFFMTGKAYFEQNDFATAEPFFKKAMKLEPNHLEVFYYLGTICKEQGRFDEAEVYFRRLNDLRPEVEFMPVYLGEVYKKWGRLEAAERIYRDFLNKAKMRDLRVESYLSLNWILREQGRHTERELLLWEFINTDYSFGKQELVSFYNDMVTKYPDNPDWQYRYADFEYKIINHYSGIIGFQKLYKLDSNYSAIGHALALIGQYYLNEAERPIFNESLPDWQMDNPIAIHYLELSVQKAPKAHAVKYDLVTAYLRVFKYKEAIALLDSLRKNGGLDFPNRLVLADLLLRSGHFDEAKAQLDKAWDIQPEAVPRLPEITGKWQQLHGDLVSAIQFYEQELPFAKGKAKANICYTLARLNGQKGNKEASLEWLRQAADNGFNYPLVMKYDLATDSIKHTVAFGDYYKQVLEAKKSSE